MKKRYTWAQFIGRLGEADAGLPVKDLCRKHGSGEPSYYALKANFGGMSAMALRCQPRDDGSGRLRERLTELAGRHHHHGYRLLRSRLRIDGWAIKVKARTGSTARKT